MSAQQGAPSAPGQGNVTHTWEAVKSDANWANIHEDDDGNIISNANGSAQTLAQQIRARRKRISQLDHAQSSKRILRDMIRYIYIVLDLSEAVYEKDASLGYGPSKTRLDVMLQLITEFTNEYYDQNPLSHLGLVICKNGEAQVLSLLTGSKRSSITAIGALREGVLSGLVGGAGKDAGEFSFQNGLEVAGRSLGHMPQHGSREILVMVGALSTSDPGDLLTGTLPKLLGAGVRVNCLAMCAEVHICRKISESTGGVMGVALDGRHLKDLLMRFIAPPPALRAGKDSDDHTCEFIPMGFPTRETEDVPTLIHAVSVTRDNKLFFGRTGYVCPRCKAKASEIPSDCAVCGLKLVLAPHLARSFHHLFPVPPFVEVAEDAQVDDGILDRVHGSDERNGENGLPPSSFLSLPPVTSSFSYSFDPPPKLGFQHDSGAEKEVNIDSSLLFSSKDCDRCCFSCLKVIGVHAILVDQRGSSKGVRSSSSKGGKVGSSSGVDNERGADATELRFQCPDCKNVFCSDCDEYLHGTLHNCPGCLCR